MSHKHGFWHSTYPLADRYKNQSINQSITQSFIVKKKTDQSLGNNWADSHVKFIYVFVSQSGVFQSYLEQPLLPSQLTFNKCEFSCLYETLQCVRYELGFLASRHCAFFMQNSLDFISFMNSIFICLSNQLCSAMPHFLFWKNEVKHVCIMFLFRLCSRNSVGVVYLNRLLILDDNISVYAK